MVSNVLPDSDEVIQQTAEEKNNEIVSFPIEYFSNLLAKIEPIIKPSDCENKK